MRARLLVACLLAHAGAARADLRGELKPLPLRVVDGKLDGEGGKLLVTETRAAQFVLVGEEHNNRDLPSLVAALLAIQQEAPGGARLHVEADPLALRGLEAAAKQGGADAVTKWVRTYPNALAFMTDEELALLTTAARLPGAGRHLSGGDQVFGALHILDRLAKLATTPAQKKQVAELREEAAGYEAPRFAKNIGYVDNALLPEKLDALLAAFAPKPPAEAAELLDALGASARIYRRHAKPETAYDANLEREERMRRQFIADYADAARAADQPRFVLKYGDWHLIRGPNKGHIHSLGSMICELAEMNGTASFSFKAFTLAAPGERGDPRKWAPWIAPFADAADENGWTVFDVRPLRALAAAGKLGKLDSDLERYLFGFDAFVFVGKTAHGDFKLTADRIGNLYPPQN